MPAFARVVESLDHCKGRWLFGCLFLMFIPVHQEVDRGGEVGAWIGSSLWARSLVSSMMHSKL